MQEFFLTLKIQLRKHLLGFVPHGSCLDCLVPKGFLDFSSHERATKRWTRTRIRRFSKRRNIKIWDQGDGLLISPTIKKKCSVPFYLLLLSFCLFLFIQICFCTFILKSPGGKNNDYQGATEVIWSCCCHVSSGNLSDFDVVREINCRQRTCYQRERGNLHVTTPQFQGQSLVTKDSVTP